MNKNQFSILMSLVFAVILGGTWGALLWQISPNTGLLVGSMLAGITFYWLLWTSVDREEQVVGHGLRRRFND